MIQIAVFAVVALAAVIAGVFLVLTRNAVHSALFLVGVQLCLAVLFLLQGAFLVSVLQIIVYAGAIMVLFVFLFVWLRATLPRLRYDRLMAVGWRVLIPAALTWLVVSGLAMAGSL